MDKDVINDLAAGWVRADRVFNPFTGWNYVIEFADKRGIVSFRSYADAIRISPFSLQEKTWLRNYFGIFKIQL